MIFRTNRAALRRFCTALFICQVSSLSPIAYANPNGPTVVHGDISIGESGAVMTITQGSDRAIINWQGFSNASGETIRFQQPAATAAALNRVTSSERSVLDGSLQSNGRVFILNPNGVIFGKTARINAAALVVSTLSMSDDDFKSGNHVLRQDSSKPLAAVINRGIIQAPAGGSVALIAPIANNEGLIGAEAGKVALAAGSQAVVTMDDRGLVSLGVRDAPPASVVVGQGAVSEILAQAVNNGHLVEAGYVTVDADRVTLGGAEGLAMNQGVISVGSGRVEMNSTQLTHLAPGSHITAEGGAGRGGTVNVLGQRRVGVFGDARVDASGGAGGGTVLVGGPARGRGPVQRARATFVDTDAVVSADAGTNGNGGNVVVWGDELARVNGLITARGGAAGGNGGLIETSGDLVDLQARTDTSAPRGQAGTYLIDPRNIRIVAPASGTGTLLASDRTFTATTDCSTIETDELLASLAANASVVVFTNTGNGTQRGDITVDAPIDFNGIGGVHELLLLADGNITVNQAIFDSQPGGEVLAVGLKGLGGCFTPAGGTVTVNAAITTGRGSVQLFGDNVVVNAPIDTACNALTVIATTGTASQSAAGVLSTNRLQLGGAGTIDFTAAANEACRIRTFQNTLRSIEYNSGIPLQLGETPCLGLDTTANNGSIAISAPSLTITGKIRTGCGAISLTARTGAITDNDDSALDFQSTAVVTLVAATTIGIGGANAIELAASELNSSSGGDQAFAAEGGITLRNISSGGALSASSTGDMFMCAPGGHAVVSANITLSAGGALALSNVAAGGEGLFTAAGALTATNVRTRGAGTFTTTGSLELRGISIGSAGLITAAGSAEVAGIEIGGAGTITSGGTQTLGNVSVEGAANISAADSIVLGGLISAREANLVAGGDITGGTVRATLASIDSGGVIGTLAQPLQVAVGALRVDADGARDGISVNLNGTIAGGRPTVFGDGLLESLGVFNGIRFFPESSQDDVGVRLSPAGDFKAVVAATFQGNASVALTTVGIAGMSSHVLHAGMLTEPVELIQGQDASDESGIEGVTADNTGGESADESAGNHESLARSTGAR